MLYLGIDQHRKQLTVSVRNEAGDVVLRGQVSTQWDRVRAFFEELRRIAEAEGGFAAIVEVCGFNDWLLKMLAEYGCRETVLIQVEKRSKKKTDRRDAHQLGGILWVNRHRLLAGQRVEGVRRVQPPTEREAEDRQLTALRQRLGQLRTRTINKIKHLLRKHNLPVGETFPRPKLSFPGIPDVRRPLRKSGLGLVYFRRSPRHNRRIAESLAIGNRAGDVAKGSMFRRGEPVCSPGYSSKCVPGKQW
jgi:transposase